MKVTYSQKDKLVYVYYGSGDAWFAVSKSEAYKLLIGLIKILTNK